MNLLFLIAAAGLSVPMEDKPRSYITDAAGVEVPDSPYYQRRLADGDVLPAIRPIEAAEPLADAAPELAPGTKTKPKAAAPATPGE
ncbi:MAG: DUF2635 domain-containing protein [Undibacterium sp.]|uniref:DUF2635 domain-containing protein n=1 Tax=Undibacterium sp. TaxID=1914977 RepID=UPI00272068D5|nr:DUF2635 domain-containing protein [Undibacterium sp.]MDO8654192.1 DUF2635 domain-containing protein [Undibacterium sp.]